MLRSCIVSKGIRTISMVTPNHPAYKSSPNEVFNCVQARLEVQNVTNEITKLMIFRDQRLQSSFHVARLADGKFKETYQHRMRITREIISLRNRKIRLLEYIKRNEEINANLIAKKQEQSSETTAAEAVKL
eukprot:TRINITY_DN31867_c0_g1_i1.p1 TRINITY_DN31867_c0_g1~~TRINITY_DN31867_c0_g1_i1.p1  ORF type:complete len:147 (+),score=20.84 TRINITY_DN31867_c0_g1_i1:49-441(+)